MGGVGGGMSLESGGGSRRSVFSPLKGTDLGLLKACLLGTSTVRPVLPRWDGANEVTGAGLEFGHRLQVLSMWSPSLVIE